MSARNIINKQRKFVTLTMLLALISCAPALETSEFTSQNLNSDQIDTVTILPHADIRIDRSVAFESDWLRDGGPMWFSAIGMFEDLTGHSVIYRQSRSLVDQITEDAVIRPYGYIVDLVSKEDGRWIFVFIIEDFVAKETFGSAYASRCRALLVDNELGEVIWMDSVANQTSMGGLAGMLLVDEDDELFECFRRLVLSFPRK